MPNISLHIFSVVVMIISVLLAYLMIDIRSYNEKEMLNLRLNTIRVLGGIVLGIAIAIMASVLIKNDLELPYKFSASVIAGIIAASGIVMLTTTRK